MGSAEQVLLEITAAIGIEGQLIFALHALLLGLAQGRLAVGAPADLVLFELERAWKVDVDRFRSKSKNSAFDERPVQGLVRRTIVDGRTVFDADAVSR